MGCVMPLQVLAVAASLASSPLPRLPRRLLRKPCFCSAAAAMVAVVMFVVAGPQAGFSGCLHVSAALQWLSLPRRYMSNAGSRALTFAWQPYSKLRCHKPLVSISAAEASRVQGMKAYPLPGHEAF